MSSTWQEIRIRAERKALKGAYLVKSATKNNDDTYKIQLESWVTGKVEQTTGSAPLDIVLVLDQSGSMAENGKLSSLKTAVSDFVAAINEDAVAHDVEHRIAIVGFASNRTEGGSNYESGAWYNTGIFVNGTLKNYETYEGDWTNVYLTSDSKPDDDYEYSATLRATLYFRTKIEYDAEEQEWGYRSGPRWDRKWNKVTPKTDANDDNSDHIQVQRRAKEGYIGLKAADYQAALVNSGRPDITTAIKNLSASGATRASYGMEMANKVFENNALRDGSSRVVVFFTDGEPGQDGYETDEAGRAIAQAHTTKNNPYNAKVFSVGMFDKDPSTKVKNFMNYVSSNYPDANASEPSYIWEDWTITSGDPDADKYYMTVTGGDLSDVFQQISGSILTSDVAADANTVLTDKLSQYFDFAVDEDGTVTGVTVQKQKYNGDGQAWGEPESVDNVSVALAPAKKTVTVSGFDYSDEKNVVTDGTNGTNPSGYKLVVTFNVKPDTDFKDWGASGRYVTNSDRATLAKDNDTFATVDSPDAAVDTYQVTYQFDKTAPSDVERPVDTQHYISGQKATVMAPGTPDNTGNYTYTFNGWKNGEDDVKVDEEIKITGNVTLSGSWSKTPNTADYTVNYLWNNKPIKDPTTGSKSCGETVTVSPAQIEGYTPVSTESHTITIDADNSKNVINLNYYKNVTLTANSDTVTYNGKEQTVEGYTCDTPNVTFEGITASGKGTDAGTYDVTFSEGTVGKVDETAKYIVTDTTDGKLTITEASAPTPGTFDFNDVVYGDGKDTPAITKTVKGNVGKNFTEAFYVTVKGADEKSTATMSAPASYTGKAEVTYSDLKDIAFQFTANNKLTFRDRGTYTYTVREVPGKTSRMSYDTTEYTLTIKVVLNKNTNKYEVESWQFTPGNREYTTALNIVNTYRTYHPSTPSKPTLNTGDHYAYVMGYPDGTVRPNGSITRAEVSAILFRLLSDKTRDEYFTTESSFTDVKAGAWYNNSIATLEKAGVIVDTAKGGAFRPNEAITRAELAAMLAQFSDAKPVKGVKFSDVSAEHWAYEAIAIAAKMGWIEGYPDGTFRPDATITRAEMMTLVNRALERVPSDEDHLLSKRVMLTFPDCKSGDWFYIAVQEATNSHTYERAATEKNGDEQWIALRANRDWTQLEK